MDQLSVTVNAATKMPDEATSTIAPSVPRSGDPIIDPGNFFGREPELHRIGELLTVKSVRVVNIVGRKGIGKTALAVTWLQRYFSSVSADAEFARALQFSADAYGVSPSAFIEQCCDMAGSPAREDIHKILRVPSSGDDPRGFEEWQFGQVAKILGRTRYLILIDHADALLESTSSLRATWERLISAIVRSAPNIRLLVTSRAGLELGDSGQIATVVLNRGLDIDSAVALLRATDPDQRGLGHQNTSDEALSALANWCKCLPEALKLIGGWARGPQAGVPASELLGLLDSSGSVADRIDHFYKDFYSSLSGDEWVIMESAAVLHEAVSRKALIDVALRYASANSASASESLDSAVTKLVHLFLLEPVGGVLTLGGLDYDYIQRHRRELLGDSVLQLERAAAEHYRAIDIGVPDDWRRLEDVKVRIQESEHWLNAREYDRASCALASIDLSFLLWSGHGRLIQGIRDRLSGKIADAAVLQYHNLALGWTYLVLGPLGSARSLLRAALDGDSTEACRAKAALGEVERRLGDLDSAISILQEVKHSCPARVIHEGSVPLALGLAYAYGRDWQHAEATALEMLAGDDRLSQGQARGLLALTRLGQGDLSSAMTESGAALTILGELREWDSAGYMMNLQGVVFAERKDYGSALEILSKASEWSERESHLNPRLGGLVHFNMSLVYLAIMDTERALKEASISKQLLVRMSTPLAAAPQLLVESIDAGQRGLETESLAKLLCAFQHSAWVSDMWLPSYMLRKIASLVQVPGNSGLELELRRLEAILQPQHGGDNGRP